MYKIIISIFFVLFSLLTSVIVAQESTPTITPTPYVPKYPISVDSCGKTITFSEPPKRTLVFDTNMTEIMLALELEAKIAGYWLSGAGPISDDFAEQIEDIPLISEELWPPPGMEIILSFDPDFIFGAWGYSFSEEWGVTPEQLAKFDVISYELSETCLTTGTAPDETLEGVYQDIRNIGLIFGVADRADIVIDQMRKNIADVQELVGEIETPIRVMYYGGGEDAAFTAGKYAMPTKLMQAAGAENIFADVEADWIPEASWESVIELDPEFIIIDDTPWGGATSIETLKSLPQLADITAVREEQFIVVPWTYILPGVEMDNSIMLLAREFYPELFEK